MKSVIIYRLNLLIIASNRNAVSTDNIIPQDQAKFHPNVSFCDQPITYKENDYDENVKTAVLFIEISSTFYLEEGTAITCLDVIHTKCYLCFLTTLSDIDYFTVYFGEKISKRKVLNINFTQGPVLFPLLY